MCYRIIFGLVNVCVSDFFEFNSASHLEATPTNCTNNVVTVVLELPTSPFELSTHGIVSQLIEWISLLLLLLNAQSNKLILHRFYCVTVSDFDFILFDFLCSLVLLGYCQSHRVAL